MHGTFGPGGGGGVGGGEQEIDMHKKQMFEMEEKPFKLVFKYPTSPEACCIKIYININTNINISQLIPERFILRRRTVILFLRKYLITIK
jgi:hypothetical protein